MAAIKSRRRTYGAHPSDAAPAGTRCKTCDATGYVPACGCGRWLECDQCDRGDLARCTDCIDGWVPAAPVANVTTTLTAPGERAVKVNGQYIGLVFRDAEGWHYAGRTAKAFRTFTQAARYTAVRTGYIPA